jgi:hypothetical protein
MGLPLNWLFVVLATFREDDFSGLGRASNTTDCKQGCVELVLNDGADKCGGSALRATVHALNDQAIRGF